MDEVKDSNTFSKKTHTKHHRAENFVRHYHHFRTEQFVYENLNVLLLDISFRIEIKHTSLKTLMNESVNTVYIR